MATPTIAARSETTQQTSFIRARVQFNTLMAGTGIHLGTMPVNSFITKVMANVDTPFNAGTTNVITVGTTLANANELFASGDITPGTAGYVEGTKGRGTSLTQTASPVEVSGNYQVDTTQGGVGLYAKYTQTGAAATAGQVTLVIEFVPAADS